MCEAMFAFCGLLWVFLHGGVFLWFLDSLFHGCYRKKTSSQFTFSGSFVLLGFRGVCDWFCFICFGSLLKFLLHGENLFQMLSSWFLDRVCLVDITFLENLVPVHILGHVYLSKVLSLLSVGDGKKVVLSTA